MSRFTSSIKNQFPWSARPFLQLALAVVFMICAGVAVFGQTEVSAQTDTKPAPKAGADKPEPSKPEQPTKEAKQTFTLSVTEDQIVGISLKAKDTPVREIAAELSKRLRIPISVTPIVQNHKVTTNFSDLVLEPAMQQLAPQVFVDYEIDMTPGKPPRPLGIFLQGYNEPPPADNAVVHGNSDVMVIEGDTEDTGEAKDNDDKEQELKVKFEKGELTVIAKKQPLVVVLYAVANELGIPLQVQNEIVDPISINIQKASVESALQQLSQNIRLFLRADLMTQERRPLRILLVEQDKKS